MNDLILALQVLLNIYKNGAFSSIELNKSVKGASNQAMVTRLVYGVLQKDVQLEYYLGKTVKKRPSKTVCVLLKLGMYCLVYIDSIPSYAIVDSLVEICGKIGKRQLKGFVNAVLKNFDAEKIELPSGNIERLSVESSVPLWLVEKYCDQYGYGKAKEFLTHGLFTKEHLRPNLRKWKLSDLQTYLDKERIPYAVSPRGGLYVDNCATVRRLNEAGKTTFQSATSMAAAQAMEVKDGERIVDLCSAPGGKSVYMSELASIEITACDVRDHRLELIKSYVSRMSAERIEVRLNDGAVYNGDFAGAFDKVLCDVPCSGLGVAAKKADVYLNASEEKINSLSRLQYDILCNASKYATKRIVYSTCTLLREENEDIVEKFIKENAGWQLVESKQYLPDGNGQDGFFIAILDKAV